MKIELGMETEQGANNIKGLSLTLVRKMTNESLATFGMLLVHEAESDLARKWDMLRRVK